MIDCPCSGKHVPAPVKLMPLDRPDGSVLLLCPTAIYNVLHLLEEYGKANGIPLGSVTKHYGRLIRALAQEIYNDRLDR